MMKCYNCGNELKGSERFCTECGKPVPPYASQGAPSTSQGEPASFYVIPPTVRTDVDNAAFVRTTTQPIATGTSFVPEASASTKRKKKRGVVIGIMSIVVCVIAFVAVVFVVLPNSAPSSGNIKPASDSPYGEIFTEGFYYSEPEDAHIAQEEGSVVKYVDNEIVLFANQGATKEEVLSAFDGYEADVVGYMDAVSFYQIRLPSAFTKAELDEIAETAGENEAIDEAFVNRVDFLSCAFSYEPEYSDYATPTWALEAINAYEAWSEISTSQTVNVGIMDTQFYDSHEDLKDSFVETMPSRDEMFVANDGTGSLPDRGEHGTHVAGIIGARHNGMGIDGVCDACNLYGYTVWGTETNGAHRNGDISAFVGGLIYLIDDCDCKVINISMGSGYQVSATHGNVEAQFATQQSDRIYEKLLKALIAKGHDDFVVCHTAGNEGEEGNAGWQMFKHIEDPDVSSRIITVGSLEPCANNEYKISHYSCGGSDVDIVAPGTDVYSTVYSLTEGNSEGVAYSDYKYGTGTSMAAPVVSGVAALILSANNELKGDQVAKIITDTAGSEVYVDNQGMAHNCVDAFAAVKKALSLSQTNQSEVRNESEAAAEVNVWDAFLGNRDYLGMSDIFSNGTFDLNTLEYSLLDINQDGKTECVMQLAEVGGGPWCGSVVFAYDGSRIYLVPIQHGGADNQGENMMYYYGALSYDKTNKQIAYVPFRPNAYVTISDVFAFDGNALNFCCEYARQSEDGASYTYSVSFADGRTENMQEQKYNECLSNFKPIEFVSAS